MGVFQETSLLVCEPSHYLLVSKFLPLKRKMCFNVLHTQKNRLDSFHHTYTCFLQDVIKYLYIHLFYPSLSYSRMHTSTFYL